MPGPRGNYGSSVAVAAMLISTLGPIWAAEPVFQGELDPFPFTPATRAVVAGIGTISATLDGNNLTIQGTFTDLPSPATAAHLRMGLAMGVPGAVIGELTVSHEVAGTFTGKVMLNDTQLAGLRRNAVYVQIDSVKAPDGNLWGWLEIR
jgi:hypothetical protein